MKTWRLVIFGHNISQNCNNYSDDGIMLRAMTEILDVVDYLPRRIHQVLVMIQYPPSGGNGVGF